MTNPTDALLAKIEEIRSGKVLEHTYQVWPLVSELTTALTAAAQRERELLADNVCLLNEVKNHALYDGWQNGVIHCHHCKAHSKTTHPLVHDSDCIISKDHHGSALLAEMETLKQRAEEAEFERENLTARIASLIDNKWAAGAEHHKEHHAREKELQAELAERDKRIAELNNRLLEIHRAAGEAILAPSPIDAFKMLKGKNDALAAELARVKVGTVCLIGKERQRQISQEGWTLKHDDQHNDGSLANAAACYAMTDKTRTMGLWPFDREGYWKPTPNDRIRELVKAGALIVAEIERLQRAALVPEPALTIEQCANCGGTGVTSDGSCYECGNPDYPEMHKSAPEYVKKFIKPEPAPEGDKA